MIAKLAIVPEHAWGGVHIEYQAALGPVFVSFAAGATLDHPAGACFLRSMSEFARSFRLSGVALSISFAGTAGIAGGTVEVRGDLVRFRGRVAEPLGYPHRTISWRTFLASGDFATRSWLI
jgi:hypothetical protein